jgi:hypothetical protein
MFGFLPGPTSCTRQCCAQHYSAHFCGLCNRLRQDYGLWARWLINRDSTFLSLLGSSQLPQPPKSQLATCCNPYAAPKALNQEGLTVHYAAAVTLCGLQAKLEDEIEDEQGLRRHAATMLMRSLDGATGLALERLHGMDFPVHTLRSSLAGQQRIEKQGADLFTAAQPTAQAYAEICAHTARIVGAAENVPLLHRMGHALGTLIYTEDAWSDRAADLRRGRYNPLLHATASTWEKARLLVQQELQTLQDVLQQLPLLRYKELLQSVLIHGSQQRMEPLLASVGGAPLPPPSTPSVPPPVPPLQPGQRPSPQKPLPPPPKRSFRQRCSDGFNSCCDCCGNGCDCTHCCDCINCLRAGKGGRSCCSTKSQCIDCNPCDGDGCECCGCDCCPCDCS